jgi:anti-sigma B factor antagonist
MLGDPGVRFLYGKLEELKKRRNESNGLTLTGLLMEGLRHSLHAMFTFVHSTEFNSRYSFSGRLRLGLDGVEDFSMKMTTSIRQAGAVTVVDISGRIELGGESAALRDMVCDLLSKGHKQILLNLGDVHYIDSSGLGALVTAFTTVRKQGGELKLLNLTNKVNDLMQITKLYTVFDITNNEAEAVKSFTQPAAATAS